MMRYLSFAQEYEDIILYSALGRYVQKGFYVDIGANDPCIISVTKFFYDMGWRGINIEPLEDMYELLCRERREDRNINVGISDKNGEMEFYVKGQMSSFCSTEKNLDKIVKPVKRFKDIWKETNYGDNAKEVHFCKIDVEGYEKNVLKGMDFGIFRPWIFCIESTLPGTGVPCYEEWEDILISNGYFYVCQYGINRYYIERDKKFLEKGLLDFKKMFVENEIWKASYRNNYLSNRKWLNENREFVIFGAGYYMQNFISVYGDHNKPSIIVDNSESKQGMVFMGIEVKAPDVLKGCKDVSVLICCARADDIKNQLEEMGINNYVKYNYIRKL